MIEMTRDNIRIDPVLEVDTNWNPPCVVAYVEIWFDADAKFGTQTQSRDDAWVNLYAIYSPVYHTVQLEYYVDTDTGVTGPYSYGPTEAERALIMEMIEEKCQDVEKCSCLSLLLMEG